jgi:hypothetical protein
MEQLIACPEFFRSENSEFAEDAGVNMSAQQVLVSPVRPLIVIAAAQRPTLPGGWMASRRVPDDVGRRQLLPL